MIPKLGEYNDILSMTQETLINMSNFVVTNVPADGLAPSGA